MTLPTSARQCAILLAMALLILSASARAQVERYVEGVHYTRMPDNSYLEKLAPQRDKADVLEVFWYGCGHCYAFEPLLEQWVGAQAGTVNFSRSPMIWNASTRQHARLFFASQQLGITEELHGKAFDTIHQQHNHLLDESSTAALFQQQGVSEKDFADTYNSFATDTLLRRTEAMQREMHIPSVPALIVNGRYLVTVGDNVRDHDEMLAIVEFLASRELSAVSSLQ